MKPIRVLFFFQAGGNWINLRPVYEVMRDDPRFDVEVWTVLSDFKAEEFVEPSTEVLERDGTPFKRGTDMKLERGQFDVAMVAVPYDAVRAPEFRVPYIKERVRHLVYIPYALEMDGSETTKIRQYSLHAHALASAIFVRSEFSRKMYRQHCPTGDKHVFATGLPRLDGLYDLENRFAVDPSLTEAIGDRFPVLWNTHFSVNENRISTFDRIGADVLAFAVQSPDVALIWRPHPALFLKMSDAGVLNTTEMAALKQELADAGVILDQRDDHRHAFAASRALVTDMSSFLLEYLTTGKPILYTINPDGLPLTEEGDRLVQNYERAQTADEVISFIGRIQQGDDPLREARRKALPDYLAGFDGQAAQRAADRIYQIASAK
jgi:hypothetical protein